MSNMSRLSNIALASVLLALAALLAAACGESSELPADNGGGDAIATSEPHIHEPRPTEDPLEEKMEKLQENIRESIREIEQSSRGVRDHQRDLRRYVGSAERATFEMEEPPLSDWFDECCEDAVDDMRKELETIDSETQALVANYQEAGLPAEAFVAGRVGGEAANVQAALDALAGASDPEAAPPLLDDIDAAVALLQEAIADIT